MQGRLEEFIKTRKKDLFGMFENNSKGFRLFLGPGRSVGRTDVAYIFYYR